MKIFKFQRKIKKVVMTQGDKDKARGHILAAMNNYPVRNIKQSRHLFRKAYEGNLFITKNYMYTKVIIALVVLLGGVGTVAAAENSLPGSPLYPVKVHVNENVRGAFAVTANQQVRWDARVIERRIAEAVELSARGELNAEIEAELQAEVDERTERMEENFIKLESRGEIQTRNEVAAELDGVLKTYSGVSTDVGAAINLDVEEKLLPLLKLKGEVQGNEESQIEAKYKNEEEVSGKANTEIRSKIETEVNSLKAIRDELNSTSSEISADLKVRADASLNSSAKVVEAAQTSLRTQFDSELSQLVNTLVTLRAEVKSLLDIKTKLDVKVDNLIEGGVQDTINTNFGSGSSITSESSINDDIKLDTELENTLKGQLNF